MESSQSHGLLTGPALTLIDPYRPTTAPGLGGFTASSASLPANVGRRPTSQPSRTSGSRRLLPPQDHARHSTWTLHEPTYGALTEAVKLATAQRRPYSSGAGQFLYGPDAMPDPSALLAKLSTLDTFIQQKRAEALAASSSSAAPRVRKPFPPRLEKLSVYNPLYGTLAFDQLNGATDLCVGDLKRLLYERLMLPATRQLTLTQHGRALYPDTLPLTTAGIVHGTRLEMHVSYRPVEELLERGMRRVRVSCSCLYTRQLACEAHTTVLALKQQYLNELSQGQHVWFTRDGVCVRKSGTTVLANATCTYTPPLYTPRP